MQCHLLSRPARFLWLGCSESPSKCLSYPFQACLVHTNETIRLRYFMDHLLERHRPVMLVGNAGTGKSVIVGDKLSFLDSEQYLVKNVPFNYYTTSAMLQGKLLGEVGEKGDKFAKAII